LKNTIYRSITTDRLDVATEPYETEKYESKNNAHLINCSFSSVLN